MALPDNRLRFPAPRIDFDADVGITGLEHDNYPAAGQQPRYDWMRMYLIGLLSNQSGFSEPTEYRQGTLWYDLNTLSLKIWSEDLTGGSWKDLSNTIALSSTVTLQEWYDEIDSIISASAPTIVFNGSSTTDGISEIPIPDSIRGDINTNRHKAFIFINGSLVDPRKCTLVSNTNITLTDVTIDNGDTFTVEIKNVSTFYETSVVLS